MKRHALVCLAVFLLLGFLGLLVVASGIVPVKASSGHWGITRAALSFAMRRSVETHAIGTRVPDLDDAALVLRGAGHYHAGCQPCHGAPGDSASVIARSLTPEPPYLPETVTRWEAAELFQIVLHGVKMTGMPAWPALEREDEVWAVVAFLRTLPGLDAEGYRRLARGEPADSPASPVAGVPDGGMDRIVRTCARCHGTEGLGRGMGAFPRIAGQSPSYLAAALAAYAAGARHSGIMEPVAAALDEATVLELARYYGQASPRVAGTPAPSDLLAAGERIAREGIPARKVAACVDCHGPVDRPRNPYYPELAGQYAPYLELQLRLFREQRRGGSPYVRVMREVVHGLEPDEARAVAAWYASLPWGDGR